MNTKSDDNAELACDYETPMDSQVSWRFDSKTLPVSTSTESRSKYTLLPSHSLGKDKNRSLLVISKVEQKDLGDYECVVKNTMGESNVAIELTYVPEQPFLNRTEQESGSLISHWHIRSLEPLTEVMLDYKLKDVSRKLQAFAFCAHNTKSLGFSNTLQSTEWKLDTPIEHKEQSKEHAGLWKYVFTIRNHFNYRSGSPE